MYYFFKNPSDIEAPLVRPYIVRGSRNSTLFYNSPGSSRVSYNYKWEALQTYLEDRFVSLEVFDKEGNKFPLWELSESLVYPKFDLTIFKNDFSNYIKDLNK